MVDPPRYPDSNSDIGDYPGTPQWAKVLGITAIIVVLLVVAMMFIAGGEHGPGRHILSGDAGSQTPPSRVIEDHTPPEGGH